MPVALTVEVLRSGLRPACPDRSAIGQMQISEMEAVLRSLDARVGRIEQILPTLATKDELRGVKVLIEDSRADTRLLAEHLASLMAWSSRADQMFASLMNQMSDVIQRLDRIERR